MRLIREVFYMSYTSEELQEQADPVAQPGYKGITPANKIPDERTLDKSHYV